MSNNLTEITPSAYDYPLLIKHLLHAPLVRSPDQVIVYRDRRHTYRQFRDRFGRLASALTDLGVKAGDVVAVLDWDSHRYHECYFAIPMMGAVLQTGNLALPPEQLLYTLNDTGASTLLLNVDFLPLIEPLASRLPNVKRFILLNDRPELPTTTLPVAGEYEALIESARRSSSSPTSTRGRARRRSTPQAPPGSQRACISAIARSCCTSSPPWPNWALRRRRGGCIATTSTCR